MRDRKIKINLCGKHGGCFLKNVSVAVLTSRIFMILNIRFNVFLAQPETYAPQSIRSSVEGVRRYPRCIVLWGWEPVCALKAHRLMKWRMWDR